MIPDKRYAGGNNAGITTRWYNPENLENNTTVKIDFLIHDLNEVELLLRLAAGDVCVNSRVWKPYGNSCIEIAVQR